MQNRPRWEREDRDSRIDRNRQSKRLVFRRSLFLMLVCGVGLFIPLVIQLWTISIRDHDFYQQRATDQQLMDVSVSAHRGDILDANGDVLAMSATVYNLILAPKDLMNSVDRGGLESGGAGAAGRDHRRSDGHSPRPGPGRSGAANGQGKLPI